MVDQALFSTGNGEHETPDDLFQELNREFNFTLDAAANLSNRKCERYYDLLKDGLFQPWTGSVFCNPPYGRDVGKWVLKGKTEAAKGALVVMLLPARTDTKWFHDHIDGQAEIRFIKGRLKFGKAKAGAPFPSMIVIYRPAKTAIQKMRAKRNIIKSGWKTKEG